MKYRNEYKFNDDFGLERHVWTCIGRRGAIHLHVSGSLRDADGPNEGYYGGLEVHYREPPDCMNEDAPSQDRCWLLDGPCWHDGTSLYASETLIPLWLCDRNNHVRMFGVLQREYEKWFNDR